MYVRNPLLLAFYLLNTLPSLPSSWQLQRLVPLVRFQPSNFFFALMYFSRNLDQQGPSNIDLVRRHL